MPSITPQRLELNLLDVGIGKRASSERAVLVH
jgi:hypothetical protein